MIFPFCAIVDQEEMKLGLILNVIDPSIGGLLIMGEKGTAKSTAVRALADILPKIKVIKGCGFNCSPDGPYCDECMERIKEKKEMETEEKDMEVVELPLGVTEDRVVGSLDIEHAISRGKKRFEPGILAQANRNFLYIDEVNLLEDYIVDLLLDSAAMGINRVEREGISFTHPAEFILVGTMNPEEGELRPQFLDRFGLCVEIRSITEKNLRKEILKRKIEMDRDPENFKIKWEKEEKELVERILRAKNTINQIEIEENIYDKVVELTSKLKLDGHRGDIVLIKSARAHAAFLGKDKVTTEDIKKVAPFALVHRLKRFPFEDIEKKEENLSELINSL